MYLVDAYKIYQFDLDKCIQRMTVLEFAEVVAAQLLNHFFLDMSVYEHDPDMWTQGISEKKKKNNLSNYFYCDMVGNDRSDGIGMHCLVKTELHVSKSGKKYHKSSNCVICMQECEETNYIHLFPMQSWSMLSVVYRTYKGTYRMFQKIP